MKWDSVSANKITIFREIIQNCFDGICVSSSENVTAAQMGLTTNSIGFQAPVWKSNFARKSATGLGFPTRGFKQIQIAAVSPKASFSSIRGRIIRFIGTSHVFKRLAWTPATYNLTVIFAPLKSKLGDVSR
jgi:hypothetical protein